MIDGRWNSTCRDAVPVIGNGGRLKFWTGRGSDLVTMANRVDCAKSIPPVFKVGAQDFRSVHGRQDVHSTPILDWRHGGSVRVRPIFNSPTLPYTSGDEALDSIHNLAATVQRQRSQDRLMAALVVQSSKSTDWDMERLVAAAEANVEGTLNGIRDAAMDMEGFVEDLGGSWIRQQIAELGAALLLICLMILIPASLYLGIKYRKFVKNYCCFCCGVTCNAGDMHDTLHVRPQ